MVARGWKWSSDIVRGKICLSHVSPEWAITLRNFSTLSMFVAIKGLDGKAKC